jgi:putative FmdB family regulatory protein
MPTYEYLCRECGHSFEEYQPITADSLTMCPSCGKHALKRVMGTGGGLIFKGTGFYQTDYKKNGSSPSTSTPSKEKKPEKPASTDTKPTASSAPSDSGESKSTSKDTKKE